MKTLVNISVENYHLCIIDLTYIFRNQSLFQEAHAVSEAVLNPVPNWLVDVVWPYCLDAYHVDLVPLNHLERITKHCL